MKILIDARLYGLENAGLGRYVVNLIKELIEIDKQNSYVLLLRKKYYEQLKVPDNWKKVLVDFRHYSLKEQFVLPSIINSHKPDITHFPHFNVPVFFKGNFVVTIHDILMHKQKGKEATTLPLPIYLLKRMGYHFVFKKAVINSKKVLVPSEYAKKELVDYYNIEKDKIVTTYEGVDADIGGKKDIKSILKKYKIDAPYFIYAGNAYPHKNISRVIEAIKLLNHQQSQRVIFAMTSARNVFIERIQKMINQSKANKYVRLLGFVPDDELGILFKNSIAFVFPSLSEGFGLPGLEALQIGTLVIASDIPVFKEVYKDTVKYFNPFDFTSITKSMMEAMQMSKEKREKTIKEGQDFVKRYSWSKMAEQTLDIYESCTSL